MGGEEMQQEGLDLMVDSTELGVMGFIEVAKMYPTFKKIFNMLVEEAAKQRPDAVVLKLSALIFAMQKSSES